MPSPRWKLVVDVGTGPSSGTDASPDADSQIRELDNLIQTHMPEDKNSPIASFLPGFTSLHLLLLKPTRSARENELVRAALANFQKHKTANLPDIQVATMTARDHMLLSVVQLLVVHIMWYQQVLVLLPHKHLKLKLYIHLFCALLY